VRLLWLIDSLNLGGAEKLTALYAAAVRGTGTELTVCCLKSINDNPVEEEIRGTGTEVINLGARNLRDTRALRRLVELMKARRFDLVHAHLTYAVIWGALAARRAGVPLVATLHVAPVSRKWHDRDMLRQRLLAWLVRRRACRVVAVSRAIATEWAKLIPAKRIVVVHNGVAIPPFLKRRQEVAPRLATVAVLREGKGINVLLHAMTRVVRRVPDAVLTIVGDGPSGDYLRALATELGLDASVRWLGYRADALQLLGEVDIFVHPTLLDAFPGGVLEAMASGCAVIASDVGGVPEIIDHGRTGLLVPAGDSEALAEAMVRLIENGEERKRLGEAGRASVAQRFSVDRWVAALDEVYSSCGAAR
jgi:glycosyltransferase involved in cell wall biosynthesis